MAGGPMKQTARAGQWAGAEGVFAQRSGTVSRRPAPKNYSRSPTGTRVRPLRAPAWLFSFVPVAPG
jgi:hypothetical protein